MRLDAQDHIHLSGTIRQFRHIRRTDPQSASQMRTAILGAIRDQYREAREKGKETRSFPCTLCSMGDPGTLQHWIFHCTAFTHLRREHQDLPAWA